MFTQPLFLYPELNTEELERIKSSLREDENVYVNRLHETDNGQHQLIQESLEILKGVRSEISTGNIYFLLNSWFKHHKEDIESNNFKVLFVDTFLRFTYEKLLIQKVSEVRENWEYAPDKSFLMIIGKPYKTHRVPLLYILDQRNLIKPNTNYTLRVNRNPEHKKILNKYSTNVFGTEVAGYDYVVSMQKELDVIFDKEEDKKDLHYTGIPYNVDLFQNSNFQVLIETNFHGIKPWITEKTWIAIINRMPFILVSEINACRYLEDLGFKTYREYMKHPLYDTDASLSNLQRLELIADNIEDWSNNIQNYESEIKKDIEHNFNRFRELYIENYVECHKFMHETNCLDYLQEDVLRGYGNWYKTDLM